MKGRPDLDVLRRWDHTGQVPDDAIARVTGDPRFAAAARALSVNMLERARDRKLDGLLKDIGRYVATTIALYLHVTGGLSLPRLKELCAQSGLLSPGRARAMLLYLQFLGYVRIVPERTKAQPARYLPTQGLIEAWRTHLVAGLRAAALIEPAAQWIADHLDDPRAFDAMTRSSAEGLLRATDLADRNDVLASAIMARHAGTQLIHLLLISAEPDDAFPPAKPIRISMTGAAQRLQVSRPQIPRLLHAGRDAGLLSLLPDGSVLLSPQMREQLKLYFALRLIGFIVCGAKTAIAVSATTPHGVAERALAPAY